MTSQQWRNYRAAGLAKCHGPPTQEGPGPRGRELRNFFFNFVSNKNASGQCSKSEELDFTKSIPELPDAAPDTSVYPDPEQPQQGTSKNQSEPYFSVNNIASSPYVTDKGNGLIINNEQFGFRPNHSCPHQALRLVRHISEGFKRKRKTIAVFFDVERAFDKVFHAGLFYKLHQLQVSVRLVFIIHQYLTNRQFPFRHENITSAKRLIRTGVPQGSTFSPLLYSAYTNDIPRPQTRVQLALFADDTALYLRGSNFRQITSRLQKAIDELTRWF
ncbi:Probable RNA-directed DNA polymerase from transposon BS [Eumeta japonica]|uniref:Probable RNA-directed DNA polymerase from transposon BS n=1 Tax=Eumeta variegata TaxID=151549 RepID=A0A4C1SXW5_EUMVA|nr:Probable RNA-directed DNA polymerase from transposon BS [Eumeta japonica]